MDMNIYVYYFLDCWSDQVYISTCLYILFYFFTGEISLAKDILTND